MSQICHPEKKETGYFKTQETCNKAVRIKPYLLRYVPDHFKTEEMCKKAVEQASWQLENVPDHFKT